MIAILLLSLLQLSTAAVLRQPDSRMLGLDDSLGSLLYELPEYEDPQMLEYELSKLEEHPIVSLIHLAKKRVHDKYRFSLSKEAIANFKLQLDSVISRLQTMQARVDKSATDILVEGIEKSIQDLKKLEHIIRPNIDQLLTAMHQGLAHSEHRPQGGLLNARVKRPPPVEVTTSEAVAYEFKPLTTEAPVYEKKSLSSKTQVHKIGVIESKTQIQEIQPVASKIKVHEIERVATKPPVNEIDIATTKPPVQEVEPPVTKSPVYEIKHHAKEGPVFALPPPSTEAPKDISQEEDRSVPYKDEVFKSESFKERYEMNPYQSRWTWKTAGLVK